jgi:hypothetical protein
LLDSDDYWDKLKLEKQIAVFRNNPHLDLVYCDIWIVKNNGNYESRKVLINSTNDNLWNNLMKGWHPPNPSTLLIKKNSIIEINYFDESLRHSEDHDFWLKIGLHNLLVDYCPERLSYFNYDSQDRLSYQYKKKAKSAHNLFLKWKNHFIETNDLKTYDEFTRANIDMLNIDEFFFNLKKFKFVNATVIYCKYLMNSKLFHSIIVNKFFK